MSVDWNAPEPVATETTEGVSEATTPATPSEVESPSTEAAPAATQEQVAENNASDKPKGEQTVESATTETQGETTPETSEVKRQGRKFFMEVQQLGGEAAFNEAKDIYTSLQSTEIDAKAKLSKLYQAAPRAYEDIKREVFFSHWDDPTQQDILCQDRFKASVSEIEQALAARGQVAPPSTTTQPTQSVSVPTPEQLAEMTNEEVAQLITKMQGQGTIPNEVQDKLNRLEELEKEFPQLKTQVSNFAEQQEAVKAEKITALGSEFVNEAMSPVVRMMEEAGLKVLPDDSPEEKAWKTEIWDTIITKTYNDVVSQPFAQDVQTFIERQDRNSAWGKMKLAQAQAEMAAAKRIPIYTAHRQQQRESQSSVLGKEHPPVITGGQSSLGSTQPQSTGRDAWNDPKESERWKDIAASLG